MYACNGINNIFQAKIGRKAENTADNRNNGNDKNFCFIGTAYLPEPAEFLFKITDFFCFFFENATKHNILLSDNYSLIILDKMIIIERSIDTDR